MFKKSWGYFSEQKQALSSGFHYFFDRKNLLIEITESITKTKIRFNRLSFSFLKDIISDTQNNEKAKQIMPIREPESAIMQRCNKSSKTKTTFKTIDFVLLNSNTENKIAIIQKSAR